MARWALLSSEKSDERVAVLHALLARFRERGLRVAGFYQRKGRDAEERKLFELVRLSDAVQSVVLAVGGITPRKPQDESFCDYAFSAEGFATAAAWLRSDGDGADLLVLDAVSKLESAGKGHAQSVRWALGRSDAQVVLLSGRQSQLPGIVEAFALDVEQVVGALELPVSASDLDAFVEAVAAVGAAGTR